MSNEIIKNTNIIKNPSQEELKELSLKYCTSVIKTSYGNIIKITRNKARQAQYTYIIAKEEEKNNFSSKIISREKASKLINKAIDYLKKQEKIIRLDSYIGIGEKAVGVKWYYDLQSANIAGMQQVLTFSREEVEDNESLIREFNNDFTLIFISSFKAEGYPGEQAIIVDLDNYITFVIRPDYFGESKKGALRMLNDFIYKNNGLVLHAGAKIIQTKKEKIAVAIMGLSGTGKTTTTFSKQGEATQPVQDDMICIWDNGRFSITENGCFAKTYGLKEETEPVIFNGTIKENAWLENVYPNEDNSLDFSKDILTPKDVKRLKNILIDTGAEEKNIDKYINNEVKLNDIVDKNGVPFDGWDFVVWTQNGRSIIPMTSVENAADFNNLPLLKSIGILNRDEGDDAATPGIILFSSPQQAAGYFMLGETSKTSAAGKERGKTRSPFTQPFFPRNHSLQPERFGKLASNIKQLQTWMMNTGYIGGSANDIKDNKALKIKIRHSSAMLEALFENKIKWKLDPDFRYYIVDVEAKENSELINKVPVEILNPIIFYKDNNRFNDYKLWVNKIKKERLEFLRSFKVKEEIIQAVI